MSAEAENPFQIDVSAAHDGNRDQEFEDRYGGDVPVLFYSGESNFFRKVSVLNFFVFYLFDN
jgi:DNA topoisomerase VI subunit B